MRKIICAFCQFQSVKIIFRKGRFELYKCRNCGLAFVNPVPNSNELKKFYSKNYFKNTSKNFKGYEDYNQLKEVLAKEATRKITFIRKYTQKKDLLDVGCGLGGFIKVAQKNGFKVSGNDISDFAIKKVSKDMKIPFYPGPISEKVLPKSRFEIITAWDVLEHIPQISDAIKAISNSLKKDGLLFLTTPDLDSWDSRVFGRFWYGYKKIPEHLIIFSSKSIRKILEDSGLEMLDIKMWGFVRDFKFVSQKLSLYSPLLGKILIFILKVFKLERKSIYLPLTDMMVIARKNE